jgi:uncharacterized membrane protein
MHSFPNLHRCKALDTSSQAAMHRSMIQTPPNPATRFERLLAYATIALTAVALVAIIKGRVEWDQVPATLWLHLGTLFVALLLTPVLLLRRRGDGLHRKLGWIWASAMMATALASLWVRMIAHGHFSLIHLLSVLVLVTVPLLVWRARSHNVPAHRSSVRGIVTGAIVVAGFFTFPFDRLLGHWLFG